jgi:hypothetical protein
MAPLTNNRDTKSMLAPLRKWPEAFTVKNLEVLYAGGMLAFDGAEALNAADTAGLTILGRCPAKVDNRDDGEIVNPDLGIFCYANDSSVPVADGDKVAYVLDNQTVTGYAGCTHKVVAGLVVAVTADGVWVDQTLPALLAARGSFDALAVTGAVSLPAGSITGAMLASGAGVAGLLAAGLGGSASYAKTDNGAKTLVAAHATKARAVLIVVHVDQVFANGTGAQTVVTIGETDTANKFMADSVLVDAAGGTTLVFAGTNTATKAITATLTAATGTGTGGITITVLAIPTT